MEQMRSAPSDQTPRQEGRGILGKLVQSQTLRLLLAAGMLHGVAGCRPENEMHPLSSAPSCNDYMDNDMDGLIDGNDPDCQTAEDTTEGRSLSTTECNDGRDNDGDGWADDRDPGCNECVVVELGDNTIDCHVVTYIPMNVNESAVPVYQEDCDALNAPIDADFCNDWLYE